MAGLKLDLKKIAACSSSLRMRKDIPGPYQALARGPNLQIYIVTTNLVGWYDLGSSFNHACAPIISVCLWSLQCTH